MWRSACCGRRMPPCTDSFCACRSRSGAATCGFFSGHVEVTRLERISDAICPIVFVSYHDVRVVLLAQTSGFPAGYVGLLDDDETSFDSENIGPHDMVTIVLYDFSLLDLSYTVRIDDDEQSTTKVKVRTVDLWPLFGDERFSEEPPFGTTTPTLKKLNDAALTLASMLVTDAEYRVMRNAILTNQ